MARFKIGDYVVCLRSNMSVFKGRPYKVSDIDGCDIKVLGSEYWYDSDFFRKLNSAEDSKAVPFLERYRDGDVLKDAKEWEQVKQLIRELKGDDEIQGT